MSNQYPNPVVLPDPQAFAPSEILKGGAGAALDLGRVSNYLIGNLGRDTLGQSWPEGSMAHQSDNVWQEALRYKVPIPPGCTSLTVRIFAGASGAPAAPGGLRVASTEGADSVDLSVTTAAGAYFTDTLTVDRDGDGMEELTVSLNGNTAGSGAQTVTLYDIAFEPEIDASPLPNTKVGDAIPLGVTKIFGVDDAAPAWLYQALATNIQVLRDDYPRALGIWSAGNGGLSGADVLHKMLPQLFRWVAFGRLPQGAALVPAESVTVHARMVGLAATATELRFNSEPRLGAEDIMPAAGVAATSTAAGAAAAAWKSGTVPAVRLTPGPDGLETLVAEFDVSKGSEPEVVSLTVLA